MRNSLKYNLHTHTTRCGHAAGLDVEYVNRAVAAGLKVLGFSEHAPMVWEGSGVCVPAGYDDNKRMNLSALEGYLEAVNFLNAKFEGVIDICMGFELEYYPNVFDATLERLRRTGAKYLILGQHGLGNEIGDYYCFGPTQDPDILKRYVNQVCEGLDTGVYTYLAHPDVIRFTGDESDYRREMERLCIHAKDRNIPVELNLHGIRGKRNYPNPLFWQIAGEVGNKVVMGYDAHDPEEFDDDCGVLDEAFRIVKENRLDFLTEPPEYIVIK